MISSFDTASKNQKEKAHFALTLDHALFLSLLCGISPVMFGLCTSKFDKPHHIYVGHRCLGWP